MFTNDYLAPIIVLDGDAVEIRDVIEKDLVEVNRILNEHVSFGISTVEHLKTYLEDENVKFSVVVLDDKIISLCKSTKTEVDTKFFEYYYKGVDNEFLKSNRVGMIQTIDLCVTLPEHRKKGLMHFLVSDHKVDGVPQFGTSWCKSEEEVQMMVEKYQVTNVIENYFLGDKLPCPVCVGYCKCTIVQILLH